MPHTIEPAASGRAKCRGCGQKIAKDELRFGERLENPYGEGEMTLWFHLVCGVYKRPEPFLEMLAKTDADLESIDTPAAALGGQGTLILRSRAVSNFTIGNVRHRVIASIEIEDDGPGIPRELQDAVFYPLVTSRPEGTGLGLPAAQELISRHGGLIEFESRPGRTVFFVRIPLDQSGLG